MASTTPRQRQYHAAITAQQHNLVGNLQPTLYNLDANVPPEVQQQPNSFPNPPRGPLRLHPAAQFDPLNLLTGTLAPADSLPDGRGYQPERSIGRPRLPLGADPLNLQPTLHNLDANVPPDGASILPDPIRAARAFRVGDVPVNLLLGTLGELPPGGHLWPERRDLPRPRFDTPFNLLTGALSVVTLPDGRGYQPERVSGRPQPRPDGYRWALNLHPTLYDLAANVPPVGEQQQPARVWGRAPLRVTVHTQTTNRLTTIEYVAAEVIDLWADIREGSILKVLLPYAGFEPVCVLVRVVKRTYSDSGDGLLQLEVQLLPPFALTEDLTFIADTGPIPGPKATLPLATDVPLQIQATTAEITKLQAALGLLQTS